MLRCRDDVMCREHGWGQACGGTDSHRTNLAYVDMSMGASVGTAWVEMWKGESGG